MSHIGSKSFLSLCLPTHTQNTKRQFHFFYSLSVLLAYQKNLELLHSHFEQLSRKKILVIDLLIVAEIRERFLCGVMGVVVCVCSCCPDPAWWMQRSWDTTPLAQFLYWMHSYTHFCMTTCVYFNIHTRMKTETTVRLQGQTSRSAASPPIPHPFLHLSLSLSRCLGVSPFCPRPILPPFPLLSSISVSVLQVPSSHITFLFPSVALPFVLSWWVNSWPLGLTLCCRSPALPSITSCPSSLAVAPV